jgi:pimeloyl-ACP methyl ester carboxylesterase
VVRCTFSPPRAWRPAVAARLARTLGRMIKLVLLPGMDGTGELFQPLLEALGPSQISIVVSYPEAKPLTYAELESFVRTHLPTGPFVLLGESFSGPIAISIAASNPQGLQGVVLSCSFASSPRPLAARASSLLSLPVPTPPVAVLAIALLGSFRTPKLRALLKNALKRVAPSVLRLRLAEALRVNVGEELKAIKVPLLYLQANSDWVVPETAWAEVSSALPGARVLAVSGPHLLLQSNPVASANAIQEFVSSVAS